MQVATFSKANHSRILVKASCHIFRSQSFQNLEIKPGLKVPPSVFLDGSFTLLHQTAASSLFKVMLMIMKSTTKRGLVILTKMALKMAVSRSEMTLKTGVGTPFLNRSRETKIGWLTFSFHKHFPFKHFLWFQWKPFKSVLGLSFHTFFTTEFNLYWWVSRQSNGIMYQTKPGSSDSIAIHIFYNIVEIYWSR